MNRIRTLIIFYILFQLLVTVPLTKGSTVTTIRFYSEAGLYDFESKQFHSVEPDDFFYITDTRVTFQDISNNQFNQVKFINRMIDIKKFQVTSTAGEYDSIHVKLVESKKFQNSYNESVVGFYNDKFAFLNLNIEDFGLLFTVETIDSISGKKVSSYEYKVNSTTAFTYPYHSIFGSDIYFENGWFIIDAYTYDDKSFSGFRKSFLRFHAEDPSKNELLITSLSFNTRDIPKGKIRITPDGKYGVFTTFSPYDTQASDFSLILDFEEMTSVQIDYEDLFDSDNLILNIELLDTHLFILIQDEGTTYLEFEIDLYTKNLINKRSIVLDTWFDQYLRLTDYFLFLKSDVTYSTNLGETGLSSADFLFINSSLMMILVLMIRRREKMRSNT